MGININLKTATCREFTPQDEPDNGKRWSYFNVYFLEDLRNIYCLYDRYPVDSIPNLLELCSEIGLYSKSGKVWTRRNLLELVNALKNFGLISSEGNRVVKPRLFSTTNFENDLNEAEKCVFLKIYFDYFRFKEFHSLFLYGGRIGGFSDLKELSKPIFSYSTLGKYTNNFVEAIDPIVRVVSVNEKNADVTRFWDVYVKWGVTLGIMKKYPLKPFGVTTLPIVKNLSLVYFFHNMPENFSVFQFVDEEMDCSYVYIPDIVYAIILKKRYSVEDIVNKIVKESLSGNGNYSPQSTSAIFVNEKEDFLFPKIGNTYITHLLKL